MRISSVFLQIFLLLFIAAPTRTTICFALKQSDDGSSVPSSRGRGGKRSSSKSSSWRGNAATKRPDDFKAFQAKDNMEELEFATFSSGDFAKAEARYGCLRDVFATNVGYSSLNVDWRQRFKVGEKERVLMQGHRVSGDDGKPLACITEGGMADVQNVARHALSDVGTGTVGGEKRPRRLEDVRARDISAHARAAESGDGNRKRETREEDRTERLNAARRKSSRIYVKTTARLTFARWNEKSKNPS